MKKPLKISGIVLLSLIGAVILAAALVCTVVFTPRFLTSAVNRYLRNYPGISIGKAELAIVKSYPFMSIHVEDVEISTAASFPDVYLSFDVKSLLKSGELTVERLSLRNGNADIVSLTETLGSYGSGEKEGNEEISSSFSLDNLPIMDIRAVEIKNMNLSYSDSASGMSASAEGLDLSLKFRLAEKSADGTMELRIAGASFSLNDTAYAEALPLSLGIPFGLDLEKKSISVPEAVLGIDCFSLGLSGNVMLTDSGDMDTDLSVTFKDWEVERVAGLLPESYRKYVDEFGAGGTVSLSANARGILSGTSLPIVDAAVEIHEGKAAYSGYSVDRVDSKMDITADLNEGGDISVEIGSLSAGFSGGTVSVSGKVKDLTGRMVCDAIIRASMPLAGLEGFLPEDMGIQAEGDADLTVSLKADKEQLIRMETDKISMDALLAVTGFKGAYKDSVSANSSRFRMKLSLGDHRSGKESSIFGEIPGNIIAGADITFEDLNVDMGDIHAGLDSVTLKAGTSDPTGSLSGMSLFCDFSIGSMTGQMDTLSIYALSPSGAAVMYPSADTTKPSVMKMRLSGDSVRCSMPASYASLGKFAINAAASRDTTASSLIKKWNPEVEMAFSDGSVSVPDMPDVIGIPSLDFSYSDDTLRIADSRIIMADSDFSLSGIVSKIDDFISGNGLLTADLGFVSENTDVDYLLACFSGMGAEEQDSLDATDTQREKETADDQSSEGDPFIVPKGIDITLNTDIKRALAFGNEISNVGGKVTVKDGVAVLRQLGFTSDAAKMQLTAVYKSPRKNHLFAGIDFHLIDIEIDKLIKMIPDIDSIVPMLKSFSGQAEFHLAVETYMNSKYELKKSTLLGAASVEGRNLVVLDSETFDEIAKMLMFKKKTVNMIDTLIVDMTVFRDEVDIYPFLLSMDNYKVILSGRHNLDMSFNYHIDCLSPIRLGLDVKGTLGNLKFALTPTRYKNLFVPERRNDMQERTIKLMDMINDSLKEGVKR